SGARKGRGWENLHCSSGLRYKGEDIGPGAQTGRPGDAPAGECFAWPRGLTGLCSTGSNHLKRQRERVAEDAVVVLRLGEQRVSARGEVDREGQRPGA